APRPGSRGGHGAGPRPPPPPGRAAGPPAHPPPPPPGPGPARAANPTPVRTVWTRGEAGRPIQRGGTEGSQRQAWPSSCPPFRVLNRAGLLVQLDALELRRV